MKMIAVGCEYAPVDGWEDIMPAIKAPSNYKKQEAIDSYIMKRVAELRDGRAGIDPVVGSIVRAVAIDDTIVALHDVEGQHAGADMLLKLSKIPDRLLFGLKLRRDLRLMAFDLAMREGEIPTEAQWAVGLDDLGAGTCVSIDPNLLLFGSSDMDPAAVARRVGFDFVDAVLDTAGGRAKLALALGGLLGLGG